MSLGINPYLTPMPIRIFLFVALALCLWSLDISPSPGGRTENSPGPNAFGPGNHTHNGMALKGRPNKVFAANA